MKVGLLSLQVIPQQQCNGHCACDCPVQRLKQAQQLHSALVAAQWWGDTAITLPLFWWWSTVSLVFFGRYPRSSLHSLALFPPVPVPNKQPCFCGCKAKCSRYMLLSWSCKCASLTWRPGWHQKKFNDHNRTIFPMLSLLSLRWHCWHSIHNLGSQSQPFFFVYNFL